MPSPDDKRDAGKPTTGKAKQPKTFTKNLGASSAPPSPPLAPSSAAASASAPETQAGSLRSAVSITLHTRSACRLWHGRRSHDDKTAMISMPKFAALTRNLTEASAIDDPYADMWLVRLQQALEDARLRLTRYTETIETFIADRLPEGLSVGEALSVSAKKIEMQFATPFGYMGAYLIADFDKTARQILLGRHIALLDLETSERMLFEGARIVRHAITRVHGYGFCGVTRDDVAAETPAARRALESMGKCPDDILKGEKRSDYAPFNPKLSHLNKHHSDAKDKAIAQLAAITEGLDQAPESAGADDLDLQGN